MVDYEQKSIEIENAKNVIQMDDRVEEKNNSKRLKCNQVYAYV